MPDPKTCYGIEDDHNWTLSTKTFFTIDEAVERAIEEFEMDHRPVPQTLEVLEYRLMRPSLEQANPLEGHLEFMDENFKEADDERTKPSERLKQIAENLAWAILEEYVPTAFEQTSNRILVDTYNWRRGRAEKMAHV